MGSRLQSTLALSPIVFPNMDTLSYVLNLDLHLSVCGSSPLLAVSYYWRQGLSEIWYWGWGAGPEGKVLATDDANSPSWVGALEHTRRLEGELWLHSSPTLTVALHPYTCHIRTRISHIYHIMYTQQYLKNTLLLFRWIFSIACVVSDSSNVKTFHLGGKLFRMQDVKMEVK